MALRTDTTFDRSPIAALPPAGGVSRLATTISHLGGMHS